MAGLLNLVVYIVVVCLIFWVILWFIDYVGIPEPMSKVIRVIVGLIALLLVVSLLLGFMGGRPWPIRWGP